MGTRSLCVRGGTVVGPFGVTRADVLIEDGAIAAVQTSGRVEADATIDAGGLLVLPGLVDAHVHVRDPGFTHKEDFATATAAAVAGGVTTIMVMPFDDPLTDSAEALRMKAAAAAGRAYADFALQGALGPENIDAARGLVECGAVSLEVSLADAPAGFDVADYAMLRTMLQRARCWNALVGVYCDNASLVEARTRDLVTDARRDARAFIEAKHETGEAITVAAVAGLAAETNARVHLRQVSTRRALDVARSYRAEGADLSFEVTPHHLLMTEEDQATGGPNLKVSPPLRSAANVSALRAALLTGDVDMVATDHAPHSLEEKAKGADDIWAAPGGFPGLETLLSATLLAVGDRPALLARLCAEAPARRFGLGHRKGRIEPGLDGDVVLVDVNASWTPDPLTLRTKARQSPFAGRTIPGKVVATVLGGRVVFNDGEVLGEPSGRLVTPQEVPNKC